jgi:hypothetical protein
MSENELADTISRFFKLLQSLQIKAHITGGLASSYYGEPRYTQDVDVVVDSIQLKNVFDKFLKLIEGEYLFSKDTIESSLSNGRVFQLIDDRTGFKFDIYPREGVPGELARTIITELFPGKELPLLSVEDAILSKLDWVQRGSKKSSEDILGIFNRLSPEGKTSAFMRAEKHGFAELLRNIVKDFKIEPE